MKTLTILEWRLIPWSHKGFTGNGCATYVAGPNGVRIAVVVFDGDKRISWLKGDPPNET